MIKYFHELTKEEFDKFIKEHPGYTWEEGAKLFPQPEWCEEPDAVCGIMGCMSLMKFMVKDKEYCKNCESCKK